MRYFRLSLLIIMACLLFVAPLALAGCGGGLSKEQRQTYLQLAVSYESKAKEAQLLADASRQAALEIRPSGTYNTELRRSYEARAKQYDDVAQDYRELAVKYRELATK